MRTSSLFLTIYMLLSVAVVFGQTTTPTPTTSTTALTLTSVTGVSRWSNSGTDSTGAVTNASIYGGKIGTATTATDTCALDGVQMCNSCDGSVGADGNLKPCNLSGVYDSLTVTITFTDTNTIATNTGYNPLYYRSTSDYVNPPGTYVINGNSVIATMTWTQFCSMFGQTGCTASYSGTITFGIDPSNTNSANPSDTLAVNVAFSLIAADSSGNGSAYTDCADGDTGGNGVCHFDVSRGDEKVYEDNLLSSGYPTSSSGVNFSGMTFFYEMGDPPTDESTEKTALETALFAKVTNKSTSSTISLTNTSSGTNTTTTTTATPSFSDDRITGLQNDHMYCFKMGNVDLTGNITLFTPSTVTDFDSYCAVPTKVVGLLDDKHCFIATAAFGSEMAPEVDTFRHFRNEFLLPHGWGKSFVKTYYKYSPPFANFISQSEVLRAMARGALYPLLMFAKLSLEFGIWVSLFTVFATALLLIEIYQRRLRPWWNRREQA